MEARKRNLVKEVRGVPPSKTQYRRSEIIMKHKQPFAFLSALNSALPKQDFIKIRLVNFLLLFLGLCILVTYLHLSACSILEDVIMDK